MIKLTRIHGEDVYINENNIQWIESNPDTTITFINGTRFIVKEDIHQVLSLIEGGANSNLSLLGSGVQDIEKSTLRLATAV